MAAMTPDQAWPDVFTPFEARLLSAVQAPAIEFRPRQQILRRDTMQHSALYLARGYVGLYRLDRLGRRQFVGLHLPGDHLDLAGFFMARSDCSMDALGAVTLRPTPRERLDALGTQEPALIDKLWRVSMIDAAINRYWIFRIGRLVGRARIANFLCEMLMRLYARGLCDLDGFDVPLAQIDLAEICGMTPVHASRMLAELREDGICTFVQGSVRIMKLREMIQTGHYRWDYLYLAPETDREIRERIAAKGSRHFALG